MKLDPEEQEILQKAGIEFPQDENGQPSMQLEVQWDQARATFDFEIDPEAEKTADDEKRLEGLLKVAEFRANDPNFDAVLQADGKKLDLGELYSEIISLTTDNDKIIKEISPEEQQAMKEQAQQSGDAQQPKLPSESLNYKDAPEDIKRQIEAQAGLNHHKCNRRSKTRSTRKTLNYKYKPTKQHMARTWPKRSTPRPLNHQISSLKHHNKRIKLRASPKRKPQLKKRRLKTANNHHKTTTALIFKLSWNTTTSTNQQPWPC
jgi:hypothetical protein